MTSSNPGSQTESVVSIHDDRPGVLLLHGFGGTPASMELWAGYLRERGYMTSVPLLPGHGTQWQDLSKTKWTDWFSAADQSLSELAKHCKPIAVAGLSMGGSLALRLAARRPDYVSAVLLVNPRVALSNRLMFGLPLLQHVVSSIPNSGSPVAKPYVPRVSYERLSLKAVYQMTLLWREVRLCLPQVSQPILLFRSVADGDSGELSRDIVFQGVGTSDRREIVLANSNHIATLDYDADLIFAESERFLVSRFSDLRHSGASQGT